MLLDRINHNKLQEWVKEKEVMWLSKFFLKNVLNPILLLGIVLKKDRRNINKIKIVSLGMLLVLFIWNI